MQAHAIIDGAIACNSFTFFNYINIYSQEHMSTAITI